MYVLRFWKKGVDIIGTLTTKLPGQRQSALLQVVYTANAHTVWCELADNLPWSKLRNRFLALFGSLQESCHSLITICWVQRYSKSPIHPNNYGYFLLMDSFFSSLKSFIFTWLLLSIDHFYHLSRC